ncbi:hypothetical protein NDU88_001899 [Pleurodeles waltl]|uniref:Uncharacterized protein n=1 Tax=Pleurodeles waltl TaxID=8319 RepID=A0AAV7U7R0_PLEWA|nr:hypothetical protein NDU88_001899 [Pleurodeles waltl]
MVQEKVIRALQLLHEAGCLDFVDGSEVVLGRPMISALAVVAAAVFACSPSCWAPAASRIEMCGTGLKAGIRETGESKRKGKESPRELNGMLALPDRPKTMVVQGKWRGSDYQAKIPSDSGQDVAK